MGSESVKGPLDETIAITFIRRRGRITVYKSVVAALGEPGHIRMLIHPQERILIAQGCDRMERDAIHVPRNLHQDGVSFGINSMALLESLTKLMGWSDHLTYRVKGKPQMSPTLIVFPLDQSEIVNESDGGETGVP